MESQLNVWRDCLRPGVQPGCRGAWGRGVLSREKGTDCGPTAAELWLTHAKIAKTDPGLFSHYECA